MQEVYLAHHGILGMKWGVRRYQNPDGSLTAEGRKRYAIDSDGKIRKLSSSERRAAVKMEKNRAAALEKARKARVEKAEYNKQKAEAIKSGEASKIEKYFNDLTPAEMQDAMNRINTKQNFQRMLNNEAQLVSTGKTKTDQLMDKVGKASDYAEKGIRAYNIIAKVNNAFNADTYMPSIGGEWAGDRKKRLAKEAKEEAKKDAEEKEQKRLEKIKRTGSVEDLLNNRDKMSAKDWSDALARFNAEDKLLAREADRKTGALNKIAEENKRQSEDYRSKAINIWKNDPRTSQSSFEKIARMYTDKEQEEIRRARGWMAPKDSDKEYIDYLQRSASAATVYANRNMLDPKQLAAAVARINAEEKLREKFR